MTQKQAQEMNILVIDDEDKICELIKIFLEASFSFNSVVSAPNTAVANQKFLNQEFDLLIIDHKLPVKTGIEYIQHIRTSVRFNKVKILLISGYLQQEDVLNAMELGVKNILVKPFTRQQLIAHVAEILKLSPE